MQEFAHTNTPSTESLSDCIRLGYGKVHNENPSVESKQLWDTSGESDVN